MMFILLSNDDGINSPGLLALADAFSPDHEVVIVAPERERSAISHAITIHKPLRAKRLISYDNAVTAYAVNGTPADCVKLALSSLVTKRPDFVVSGINRGPNLGTDVLYSGTVAAAYEGSLNGITSLALSLADAKDKPDYRTAANIAVSIAGLAWRERSVLARSVLNINVPNVPADDIRGIRITRLGRRQYSNSFQERQDPSGNTYYWMGGHPIKDPFETDTDVSAIDDGYISVTPIRLDLTNHCLIAELKAWERMIGLETM